MTTAQELARACELAMAARWRGDDAAADLFAVWLEAHWWPGGPAEPAESPAAISVLGGAGAGVRWHARAGSLRGYVRGRRGCYFVPGDDSPPDIPIRCSSDEAAWSADALTPWPAGRGDHACSLPSSPRS